MENTKIQVLDNNQLLFQELMKLGSIAIKEFGSVEMAIEKTRTLNNALEENQGLIRFMSDEKNIKLAQNLISPLGFFKKK